MTDSNTQLEKLFTLHCPYFFLSFYDANGASFMVTIYIILKIYFQHTSCTFRCGFHWKMNEA